LARVRRMKLLYPFLCSFLTLLLILPPLQAQAPAPDPGAVLHLAFKSETTATVNTQTASGFIVQVTGADGRPVSEAAVAFRLPDDEPTGTFPGGLHAIVVYTNASGQARSPAIQWGAVDGSMSIRITAAKEPLHAGLLVAGTLQPNAKSATANPTASNPRTPGTPGISAPQVVVVPVPGPALPNPPAVATPVAEPPALHPGIAKPAPKISDVTKSGASPAPIAPKPEVSITNTPQLHPHSNKKWLIIAVIAVGAGVGAALAMKGKSSTPAAAAVTAAPPIGTPTVTVGGSH
jgi:hypothetical protein